MKVCGWTRHLSQVVTTDEIKDGEVIMLTKHNSPVAFVISYEAYLNIQNFVNQVVDAPKQKALAAKGGR